MSKSNGKDVQKDHPFHPFMLTRAGVAEVRKPLIVKRRGKQVHLVARISAYVDLPANLKGTHMSRNLEVINEIIDTSVREEISSIEGFCLAAAKRMLQMHEYASRAEVECAADYFLEKVTPAGKRTIENYLLESWAGMERTGKGRKSIAVTAVGMSACPCAMENIRELVCTERNIPPEMMPDFPMMTHNQRNVTTLKLTLPVDIDIDADEMIGMVDSVFSSPTYEILKRADEAKTVYKAHLNPRFVEDIVRSLLQEFVEHHGHLVKDHPDILVLARSVSQESIHKHDAVAERTATLGELTAE